MPVGSPLAEKSLGLLGSRGALFHSELVSILDARGKEQDALLGLSGVRLRIARLRLGDESITLTEHLGKKGRPIPQDSRRKGRGERTPSEDLKLRT